MAGRSVAAVRKSVWRSILVLQVYDSGPMDPRQLNVHLWIKPPWTNAREVVRRPSHGLVMWQGPGWRCPMPHGVS